MQPVINPLKSILRSNSLASNDSTYRVQCKTLSLSLLRKEVIQPHLPVRLPCYDFTPITRLVLGGCLLAVSSPTSDTPGFHRVTGGVYKARERIHRSMLTCDY